MATLTLTSNQLGQIAYYKVMSRFIMFPKKGYHIRMDQKPFGNGNLSMPVPGTNDWKYQFSSFHVKQDLNHTSFKSTTEGELFGTKIVADETDYVYFKYVDGGVWQPLWGYYKNEQMSKGKSIWKETGEMSSATWGFATEVARWFLQRMSTALGEAGCQGLATGPVQGSSAKLFGQL
jgi:hypothetical protein